MNTPKTVLAILANGVEELEAVAPIDLLRRAGAEVTLASLADDTAVTSKGNIRFVAEQPLSAVAGNNFDMVFLPGGPGVAHLREDPRVREILLRQAAANRWIAAICAAPLVLKDAGLLANRRYTAYPSCADELPETLHDQRTVADGNILTARGPAVATDFGFLLVEKLFGPETVAELKADTCY